MPIVVDQLLQVMTDVVRHVQFSQPRSQHRSPTHIPLTASPCYLHDPSDASVCPACAPPVDQFSPTIRHPAREVAPLAVVLPGKWGARLYLDSCERLILIRFDTFALSASSSSALRFNACVVKRSDEICAVSRLPLARNRLGRTYRISTERKWLWLRGVTVTAR